MQNPLIYLVTLILDLYWFCLIIYIILGWLIFFRVVNYSHPFVKTVWDFLFRITEPILKKIRRYVPTINGIDISPILLFIAVAFVRYTVTYIDAVYLR